LLNALAIDLAVRDDGADKAGRFTMPVPETARDLKGFADAFDARAEVALLLRSAETLIDFRNFRSRRTARCSDSPIGGGKREDGEQGSDERAHE
jgi:hypothetical protein